MGSKHEKCFIDCKSYLLCKGTVKYPQSHLPPQGKALTRKYQDCRNEGLADPPKIVATVVSYCEWDQHHCVPLTIKWCSGGILHVLALVDTGGEVTVLQSNINNKEATSQICRLGGNPTPALQAKITLTMGNATPFTMMIDVLVGQRVEIRNGYFCFRTSQVAFAIQSVTVLC